MATWECKSVTVDDVGVEIVSAVADIDREVIFVRQGGNGNCKLAFSESGLSTGVSSPAVQPFSSQVYSPAFRFVLPAGTPFWGRTGSGQSCVVEVVVTRPSGGVVPS